MNNPFPPGGPNPKRINACPECHSYRADCEPPFLHQEGCTLAPGLTTEELDRWASMIRETR